ncbi:class I SAM-dependent methyltransferase [Saccharopolyspora sp. SCSIO 74807]|uniref:class I SAM-dependent methyltransferase n=1 Tax=Saccharopolyspora sp. SCSIO 74807 TaxID=3118084 RepID=UPI0030D4C430
MTETLPDRFCWTHRPDHGPDERLLRLRPGNTVLDLGCGRGTQLAYLSRTHHTHGIGIDHEAEWRAGVCTYAHGGTAEFLHATALDYLTQQAGSSIDAIYSRFGAIWFTDPDQLLPLITTRLQPGGRLVFSHLAPGYPSFDIPRWDHTPGHWQDRLADLGFTELRTQLLPCHGKCSYPACTGVMIVEGTR